jgi:hypothetical protein
MTYKNAIALAAQGNINFYIEYICLMCFLSGRGCRASCSAAPACPFAPDPVKISLLLQTALPAC